MPTSAFKAKPFRKLSKTLVAQYLKLLEGPQGCNFHKGHKGQTIWKCAGGNSTKLSRKILTKLDVAPSDTVRLLSFARKHGGFCDCEILFNAEKALKAKSWR